MFRKTSTLVAVALVATLGLSAFTVKTFAANTDPNRTQAGVRNNGGPGGQTDADLAKALGITTDQLKAAITKAQDAAIDAAVKAGTITQTQADQLKANGSGLHGIPGLMGASTSGTNMDQLLADALGITTDKLQAARQSAEIARIDAAVAAGNMTQDQANLMKAQMALNASESFQTALKSAYSDAIKSAVTAGTITQAQADLILKNNANFPGMGFGHDGMGRMPGFGGGRGGAGAPPAGGLPNSNGTTPSYPGPSQTPTSSGTSS
jgi:hypothetical protein